MTESKQPVLRMTAAAIVGAIGALGASQWMASGSALAVNSAYPSAEQGRAIPAVEIREGSIALVRGEGNLYFVIDRQGNGYPVRFRDSDLVMPVGSTLLRSP